MPGHHTTFGQQLIDSLQDFLARVDRGEPIKQTVVRRMKVKGQTVHTSETFAAPLRRKGQK